MSEHYGKNFILKVKQFNSSNRFVAKASFKQTHHAHTLQHDIFCTFTLSLSTSFPRFPHLFPIYINVSATAVRNPLQSCLCLSTAFYQSS